MEDWLHFVETFSKYVLRGVLSPQLATMWGHLVAAVDHYFRPTQWASPEAFQEASRAAHDRLRAFANMAEELEFPYTSFTPNLHMLICQ